MQTRIEWTVWRGYVLIRLLKSGVTPLQLSLSSPTVWMPLLWTSSTQNSSSRATANGKRFFMAGGSYARALPARGSPIRLQIWEAFLKQAAPGGALALDLWFLAFRPVHPFDVLGPIRWHPVRSWHFRCRGRHLTVLELTMCRRTSWSRTCWPKAI